MSAAALMVAGCDDVGGVCASVDDDITAREQQINGTWINGTLINGTMINGTWINGPKLAAPDGSADYTRPLTLELKGGSQPTSVWLDGSRLTAKTADGNTVTGTGLNKAKLEFEVQEGGAVNKKNKGIKIRGIKQLTAGSDVWLYDLDIKPGQGGWQPLCSDHKGEPTEAILLGDLWNPTTGARAPHLDGALTFACRDAALAKCVEYGYRPWATSGGLSLAEHHQACTRMVRADYCGDGVSHTVDGTHIHVQDPLGIQKLDPAVTFAVEAEWGPDGATCLNPQNMRIGAQTLSCQLPTCGSDFSSGGLIQSGKIVTP